MAMRNEAATRMVRPLRGIISSLVLLNLLFSSLDAAFLSDLTHRKKRRSSGSWTQAPASRMRKLDRPSFLCSSSTSSDWNQEEIDSFRQEQTRVALMEALVVGPTGGSDASNLLPIHLVGRSELPVSSSDQNRNSTVSCLVISTATQKEFPSSACIMMPLPVADAQRRLKLVTFAYQRKPLSKSVLLGLNMLLVNRDGGLFDNLPWTTWSVDPQLRNRDASNNPVDAKFHLGKRDAYYEMMGKDWKGRSASLGNLALRLKYQLEQGQRDESHADHDTDDSESLNVLARRMLELQIRELHMELADFESQLAIARTNQLEELRELEAAQHKCRNQLKEAQEALQELSSAPDEVETSSAVQSALRSLADRSIGNNAAPYRGAIGYEPILDTANDVQSASLPFTSPFDVLRRIIDEQLNAKVIGAVLENTSLLEGTFALGGAVILQRKTKKKTIFANGEELSVQDEDEDYGNVGVKGGECFLVECTGDEAVGMALASNATLSIESGTWERVNLAAEVTGEQENTDDGINALPLWEPLDKETTLLEEGEGRNELGAAEPSPLRIPSTTTSLYDSLFEGGGSPSQSTSLFPTDNPIQSLNEYDELSNDDKARTLMSMSNFDLSLPRPRVLRQWNPSIGGINPLDELLLPRVDEAVRRQYLIREAELRQDTQALEELQSNQSPRQVAKEMAEQAREAGLDDEAEAWEKEADLYGNLRADVTQDEGAYSRFLDKDEWYEREQRALRERNKKFKFGTLLDGIE